MSRRRPVALVALAVLSLGACATNDATRGDVVGALTDAGLEQEPAECVGDLFEREFDQDQLNDIGAAETPEEYPDELRDDIDQILEECIRGGGAATTSTEDTTGDTGDEGTTEDPAAEG